MSTLPGLEVAEDQLEAALERQADHREPGLGRRELAREAEFAEGAPRAAARRLDPEALGRDQRAVEVEHERVEQDRRSLPGAAHEKLSGRPRGAPTGA
jgi:hypothetical protein